MGIDQTTGIPRGLWRRVAVFAKPHARRIVAFLVFSVGASFAALIPPLLFREIIDTAIPRADQRLLAFLGLAAVGAVLANAVLALVARWFSARVGEGVIFDLRSTLFDRIQRMPISFFTRTQTGSLITRLNTDVVGAQSALTNTLGGLVTNAITVLMTLAVMLRLEWRLTLLALVVLPVFVLPARRVGRRLQAITREQMNHNAAMNSQMTERFNVAGALLVKLFGRYDEEAGNFGRRAGRVRDIGIRQAILMRGFFLALGVVAAVGTAAVYWAGGWMVITGALTVGTMVSLAVYVTQLYQPLTQLTNARVDLMTAFVSFDRVFEVLDLPQTVAESPDAHKLTGPRGHVVFEDVRFRYPGPDEIPIGSLEGKRETGGPGDWVLDGVSFEVPQGRMVALVGPSGAGKTTISSLVPRLHDVTEGRVLFDGHDVRDLTLDSLQAAIGIVTQDAHLFHETIRENLLYARPDATDDQIVDACRAARIHDLIASLSDGYDTVVGDRGYRLSGGEKQRLAIARVLLKDPAFVILDEATAHLDSTSESLIQQALAEVLSGRSSLVIAHRLSTIVRADEILVLEAGRIVERGRHGLLVAAGGLYSELYRTQFADVAG